MKFNRAYRRAQVERLRNNRKVYWSNYPGSYLYEEHNERRLGMLVSTPHPCSGWCCGNPRKWFGKVTQQEKRFQAVAIERE